MGELRLNTISTFILFLFFLSSDAVAQENNDLSLYIDRIFASSILPDNPNRPYPYNQQTIRYSAYNILDGDPETVWSEGIEGDGKGETIEIISYWDEIELDEIEIMPGYFDTRYYRANNRLKKIKLYYNETDFITLDFKDIMEVQRIPLGRTIKTRYLKIEIIDTFPGDTWNDTCISEIGFYLKGSKIIINYDLQFTYKDGIYYMPPCEINIAGYNDITDLNFYFVINDNNILGGSDIPFGTPHFGNREVIISGSWSFDPSSCCFYLSYETQTYTGIGMESEGEIVNSHSVSAELIVKGNLDRSFAPYFSGEIIYQSRQELDNYE
jgi:hypothetical protein